MKTLLDAINDEHTARIKHEDACTAVWEALQSTCPEVSRQISLLFSDAAAAANWICASYKGGTSPAEKIAARQLAEVEEILMRALHGMGA
ncbi:MAG TPA: hypothetical protein VFN29_08450 [Chiayiivirga sp.]|nr:hypothetical protein [Chiayiivirga sp.]